MGVACIIFKYVKSSTSGNIALYINDSHMSYYHTDTAGSAMLGHSYLKGPDYLVVHRWLRVMLLFLTNTILAGPNI